MGSAELGQPGLIFQIGVAPVRIDVMTAIDGVAFEAAWPERVQAQFEGLPVPVLARHHLLTNKKASGRLQDLADIERLEQIGSGPRHPPR